MESDTSTELVHSEQAETGPGFVVALGASAGGLEAVTQFFRNMPTDAGISFVVIQHLSPDFKSFMPELLGRETKMDIMLVEDSLEILPDTVYLIPPRHNIALENGRFILSAQDKNSSLKLPIDIFFRSLAQDIGPRAIGIVLSGTGADGSRGVQDIWDSGGLVIAQQPETAQFDSMPLNTIDTKKVHLIAPPQEMPQHIQQYIDDRNSALQTIQSQQQADSYLTRIFSLLRQRFSVNFDHYRPATIMRRLERRLIKTKTHRLDDYYQYLKENPNELNILFNDLIITVTAFFRDREAFNFLQDNVLPDLIDKASKTNQQLRIWVTACSSGEEAYTMAMLIAELKEKQNQALDVKIFATDVNQTVLQKANIGIYPPDEVESVPPYFRKKYFTEKKDGFQVTKQIRDMLIFAPHNLLQNPPFTNLDLVTCRNLLIYLNPPVQKRILSYMHFGMKVGGILFLGPSETIGTLEDEFMQVDKRWRIFKKRRDVRLTEAISATLSSSALSFRTMEKMSPKTAELFKRNAWQENLLNTLIPSGYIVNENFHLIHIFGEAGSYLQQPSGSPTLNILQMLDGELRTAMQSGITYFDNAVDEDEPLVINDLPNPLKVSKSLMLTFRQIKLERQGLKLYLVQFDTAIQDTKIIQSASTNSLDLSATVQTRIHELEKELFSVRNSLQVAMEELETTNEELQSTNEELIASNEQLQGTNEELHSVNEELHMVNSEYRQKINEMVNLNDEMLNLQRSSQMVTIFLDADLNIRVFTPAAADLFSLLPQDIGRPITHLLYMLNMDKAAVEQLVRQVLIHETTVEKELQLQNGRYYLMRVLPYVREGKPSGGLVLNLVETTTFRHLGEAAADKTQEEENLTLPPAYQQFLASANVTPLSLNKQGEVVYPQAEWETLTEQNWSSYRGLGWLAKVHPNNQDSIREIWEDPAPETTASPFFCQVWDAQKASYSLFKLQAVPQQSQKKGEVGWVLFLTRSGSEA